MRQLSAPLRSTSSSVVGSSHPAASESSGEIVRNVGGASLLAASVYEKLSGWFRGTSQVSMVNETDTILRAEAAAKARLIENQSKAAEALRNRDQRQAELRTLHAKRRSAPALENSAAGAEHPFEKFRPRMHREIELLTRAEAQSSAGTEKVLLLKRELESIRAQIAGYRPNSAERALILQRAQENEVTAKKAIAIAEAQASMAENRVAQLKEELRLVAIRYAQDEAALTAQNLVQAQQALDRLCLNSVSAASPVRPLSITQFNELLRTYSLQPTDERCNQLIAAYHHFGTVCPLDQRLADNSLDVVLRRGTIMDLERQHALAQEQGRVQLEAPLRARLDRAAAESTAAQGRVTQLEALNAMSLIRGGETKLSKAEGELSAALGRVAQAEQEVRVLGGIAMLVRATARSANSQMEREAVVKEAILLNDEAALTVALIAAQERLVLADVAVEIARKAQQDAPGYYGGQVSPALGGQSERSSNGINLATATSLVDQAERELQDLRLVADVARSVIQLS